MRLKFKKKNFDIDEYQRQYIASNYNITNNFWFIFCYRILYQIKHLHESKIYSELVIF